MVLIRTPPHSATADQPWIQLCLVICSCFGSARRSARDKTSELSTNPVMVRRHSTNCASASFVYGPDSGGYPLTRKYGEISALVYCCRDRTRPNRARMSGSMTEVAVI